METALKHLPGYIGSNPKTNPERQAIGAPREWEEMRKDLMTVDELEAELTKWIVHVYHHEPSNALGGLAPIEKLEAAKKRGFVAKEITNVRALDLLLMFRKDVKVQRFGIQMHGTKNQARYYMAPELLPIIGQTVEAAWNPGNLGELIVYKDDNYLCTAKNRELIEIRATAADHRREKEMQARQRRSVQERHEEDLRRAQYPTDIARAKAEREREEVFAEARIRQAANATATGVPLLLPKEARADKKLRAVPSRPTVKAETCAESSLEEAPAIIEKCHGCGQTKNGTESLTYCLNCFYRPGAECQECGGRSGCYYCEDCGDKHAHRSKDEIEQGSDSEAAPRTYRDDLLSEHPDWSWLRDFGCADCGVELSTQLSGRACAWCLRIRCQQCQGDHMRGRCASMPVEISEQEGEQE
jgi:hypothetical protein